ncbi:MAG: TonB-dependent receptor plug domain-containing protein, partial [Solirubrobacteraceae bacterium]
AGKDLTSRLTLGWYQDEYHWDENTPSAYYTRNTRDILDWQNTWEAAAWAEIVAGVNAERSFYDSEVPTTDRSLAEYLSFTLRPAGGFEVTGGLRHDHFDTAGGATTGRAGLAYRFNHGTTKLRATYGTGFNAPSPEDRYGDLPYVLPNPGIRPERSIGWDAGVDQKIGGAFSLQASYFQNRFRDLLDYEIVDPDTYAGEEINVDRATTSGVELGLVARPVARITLRASYTYLDARDDLTGERLIRRPRHTFDGGAEVRITDRWIAGAGARLVTGEVDGVYTPYPLAGYASFRLYSSYAVRPNLIVKARVENLLDRRYEEVAGYPALPRTVDGGVEWTF